MKARILAFADWYLPGCKGGGAVSAISNLIDLLGDEFEFYVFTRNRDNREEHPYRGICFDQWVSNGKAKVFYTADVSIRNIRRRVREADPQIIYLNSFFSRLTMKTLLLRKCGLLPRAAVVLAPRGEFSAGALELKSFRKRLYRKLAHAVGLYRNVVWQASSAREREDIYSSPGSGGDESTILISPEIPNAEVLSRPYSPQRPKKERGSARFVFLSRISRMKNLEFALDLLGFAQGDVELDIYGPIEDRGYWEQCQERIRRLPDRVRVKYKGAVSPEQSVETFSQYHFQILPTLGENFGYVILEGFAGGCPVLVSDQTPWRDLEKVGVGWDLPLQERQRWLEAVQSCVEMDAARYESYSQRARSYFEEWMSATPYRQRAVELFEKAMEGSASPTARPALAKPAGAGR
jgi:glycosyltransferase involved in cell wall biosynthesis